MMQPVILAAGKGTRLQSELPKALFPLNGKPLIRCILDSLKQIEGIRKPLVVIGHKGDQVRQELKDEVVYAEQKELSGTASAVKAALSQVASDDSALILYCDQPFVSHKTVTTIKSLWEKQKDALIIGTVEVKDFNNWRESLVSYGRIIRSLKGEVQKNIEYKDATTHEREIKEVNPGIYCVDARWLEKALRRIPPNPLTGEFYLTDIIALAHDEGKTIVTYEVAPQEAVGINSSEDAVRALDLLKNNQ